MAAASRDLFSARRRRLSDVRHNPAPIYDPAQKLPYFKDFLAVFRPGDIVKFKPISREEYDRDIKAVEAGTFDLTFRPVNFSLKDFHNDPGGYSRHLVEVLHGH